MFTLRLAAVALVAVSASAVAHAEVILFWSTTGVNDANMIYMPGETNFKPYMVPSTRVDELEAGAYDLFLWLKFVADPNLPPNTMIYGLAMEFQGDAAHAQNFAYRHKLNPCRRFSGSGGLPLDGFLPVQSGIAFILPPDTNCDLYYPATQEALLGAARITGAPGQTKIMAIEDIAMRHIGGEDIPDPLAVPAVVRFYALGDLDGDNAVTFDDIDPLVFALTHTEAEFRVTYPAGHYWAADCDRDHDVDFDDISPFVALLGG